MDKIIGWRLSFFIPLHIDKSVELTGVCKYIKLNFPNYVDISNFPEFYSSNMMAFGDLLEYSDNIYSVDDLSGNIYVGPRGLSGLDHASRFSVFKSVTRDNVVNAIQTSYDIILSAKNILNVNKRLPSKSKNSYQFTDFNEFHKIKSDDEGLNTLYFMARNVEITPVDTLVAHSTTTNRKKTIKRFLDII